MQDRVRCLVELDLVFGLQLDVVFGVAVNRFPGHVSRSGLGGAGNDGLHLGWQRVVLGLVEHDLESLCALVVALQHADLGDVGKAQNTVRGGVVELGAVQQAAVHGGHDLAAWQRVHSSAHGGKEVNRQAVGTELQALEVRRLGDGLFEPAQWLCGHRAVQERLHVAADRSVELGQQLSAAAVLVPCQHHVGVHAESRARVPQGQRVLLTVVVAQHAVAAVQRAFGNSFEQTESRHHSTGWQHFNLQVAAGHVIDLLGVVQSVFVEDVLGRPGALPAHGDRAGLCIGDHRCAHGARSNGGALEKAAAAWGFVVAHLVSPVKKIGVSLFSL